MKQTAVEFLLEELPKLAALSDFLDKEDFIKARTMIFEKVIKMEKEQIIDAYNEGQNTPYEYSESNDVNWYDGKQYYNETFKSE